MCVEPMIIPGFQRAVRRALHCYYNETRINTSRPVRDRCNYLLMMIFVAGETGRAVRRRGRRKREGTEKEGRAAGRASSLGPEKLSEIMSEEIGSLARG